MAERKVVDLGGFVPRPGSRRRRIVVCCLVGAVVLLGLGGSFSPAQTSMELTYWKEFSYAKETSEIGGHIAALTAVQRTGFVVLGDGQFARLSGHLVHTTAPDGKRFYQGFVIYDFEDGSSILAKVDASGDPSAKQAGTITFVAGTGRYEGITGRGTISSWRPKGWDMYTEMNASFSVPGN